MRTPGSVALAIVVGLMFVTPVLAATTLHPLAIRWTVLFDFIAAHRFGLVLGFALMIVIALMLRAADGHATRHANDIEPAMGDDVSLGIESIDGLA